LHLWSLILILFDLVCYWKLLFCFRFYLVYFSLKDFLFKKISSISLFSYRSLAYSFMLLWNMFSFLKTAILKFWISVLEFAHICYCMVVF
jgi:hypothetical protein